MSLGVSGVTHVELKELLWRYRFIGTVEDDAEVEIEDADSEQDDVCRNH